MTSLRVLSWPLLAGLAIAFPGTSRAESDRTRLEWASSRLLEEPRGISAGVRLLGRAQGGFETAVNPWLTLHFSSPDSAGGGLTFSAQLMQPSLLNSVDLTQSVSSRIADLYAAGSTQRDRLAVATDVKARWRGYASNLIFIELGGGGRYTFVNTAFRPALTGFGAAGIRTPDFVIEASGTGLALLDLGNDPIVSISGRARAAFFRPAFHALAEVAVLNHWSNFSTDDGLQAKPGELDVGIRAGVGSHSVLLEVNVPVDQDRFAYVDPERAEVIPGDLITKLSWRPAIADHFLILGVSCAFRAPADHDTLARRLNGLSFDGAMLYAELHLSGDVFAGLGREDPEGEAKPEVIITPVATATGSAPRSVPEPTTPDDVRSLVKEQLAALPQTPTVVFANLRSLLEVIDELGVSDRVQTGVAIDLFQAATNDEEVWTAYFHAIDHPRALSDALFVAARAARLPSSVFAELIAHPLGADSSADDAAVAVSLIERHDYLVAALELGAAVQRYRDRLAPTPPLAEPTLGAPEPITQSVSRDR